LLYAALRCREEIGAEHLPASLTGALAHFVSKGQWDT
jgi:hypothetical protein